MRPTLDELMNSQWMMMMGQDPEKPTTGDKDKLRDSTRKRLSQLLMLGQRDRDRVSINQQRVKGRPNTKGSKCTEDAVVPIACSTKRTESVLVADFLFPIPIEDSNRDSEAKERGISETKDKVSLLRKSRRSLFSLGGKKKVGPMEMDNANTGNSQYGPEQPQDAGNNNHIDKKSPGEPIVLTNSSGDENNWTNGLGQPKQISVIPVNSCGDTCEVMDNECTVALESEAKRILGNWGISVAMLEKGRLEHGTRSELVGIYKIVMHRLQTQQERQKSATQSHSGGTRRSTKEGKRADDGSGTGGCGGGCTGTSSNCVIL